MMEVLGKIAEKKRGSSSSGVSGNNGNADNRKNRIK